LSKNRKFGDCAVKLGYMTEEELKYVLSKKNISNQLIGQLCIEEGFIDHRKLAKILAERYSCEYVNLDGFRDSALINLIPVGFMTKYKFVPYLIKDGVLHIAMSEPMDFFKVVSELEMVVDMEITFVVASEKQIFAILNEFEGAHNVLDDISDTMRSSVIKASQPEAFDLNVDKVSTEESPIVKLVDSTILDAISKQASDIHIETTDAGIIIRYRIDGILHQATDPLETKYQSAVISRIKVMSELDIAEKRIPQDGRFKLRMIDRLVDCRISILPTIFGENAVIRILDRDSMMSAAGDFMLDGMGLPKAELDRIRRMIRLPYGMFLMTGPTGSGKTTTLYRALSEVNSKDVKVITIEDPVEYQLQGISQIQVNEKKGLTFAAGLRSILRHDPDKILVGEIRDEETAQIAIQAALTGHLVFTTVHANSSFEVVNRFIHMGIEPYNLMSALNCIVAQRLIRTLCDQCKVNVKQPARDLIDSGLSVERFRSRKFYSAKGCEQCKGTGYKGRKAIIEMVELDDDLKELFISRAPPAKLKRHAAEAGAVFLREAAVNEVIQGETTLKEANRVTFVEDVKTRP